MTKGGGGGDGGRAEVDGDGSDAQGGAGGDGVGKGAGGRGGDARVKGNNSVAVGGRGGRGGLGPGGPGGDVEVRCDNQQGFGGMGGEAPQWDGRGGRGGRAALDPELAAGLGIRFRPAHIKTPYGQAPREPGRGGDSVDTPQYMARRIIVEDLKLMEFVRQGHPLDREDAWYDRSVVSVDWINRRLMSLGYGWQMRVVDDEYEFYETADEARP